MEGQLFQEKWDKYPEKIWEQIDQSQPKRKTTKIRINFFFGLPPYTRKIGLPESRVLYTVLRSPHIDKKSRAQFQMEIKKQFLVIKTERHELRKKFFRLKSQYEILFSCKTRSNKGKLQRLFRSKIICLDPFLNHNRERVRGKGDHNVPSMRAFRTFPTPLYSPFFKK
ncbi:hypothetical protein M9H77_30763 [Catharanthus roseus]|uniref:Uncharacterized protein n=1 Tax=Catharanthus roseus TaxID=4058 RepID=A0ACB9ZYJ9_CATRO|nr:hypothetical protein M9H77_30763 [Catharanthus roseus]